MRFAIRTAITAVALAAADYILAGIEFAPADLGFGADGNKVVALVISAVALGVLNALVRPILVLISLPITCLTLGLFILVINAAVLLLLTVIPFTGLVVHDFFSAILGALVVSVVSFGLNMVVTGR